MEWFLELLRSVKDVEERVEVLRAVKVTCLLVMLLKRLGLDEDDVVYYSLPGHWDEAGEVYGERVADLVALLWEVSRQHTIDPLEACDAVELVKRVGEAYGLRRVLKVLGLGG